MGKLAIDVSNLDILPLVVLRGALAYARQHRDRRTHVLPLLEFYHFAGLSEKVSNRTFAGLVIDAMAPAVFSVDDEEQRWISWPVFESATVAQSSFQFSVNPKALDATAFF
jgi:hypothetical protein